jgi:hypothetical protein
VPLRFPDRVKLHFEDEPVEQRAQYRRIRDQCRVAVMSLDNPLAT